MAARFLAFAIAFGITPEQALDRALDAVEPPPAMRASFRATLTSEDGERRIEFDPYAEPGDQFHVTMRQGRDAELDAIVADWQAERQADVRLFADRLRSNLGAGRILADDGGLAIEFRHQISPQDGPVDRIISSYMIGRMKLDEETGFLQRLNYSIRQPLKLDGGTVLNEYRQTYDFSYSSRWGVSYVVAYELEARGGRWGFQAGRKFRVEITDVAFGLAGDATQDLASKS
ncbi:MAG: hypothetical protein SGJ21_09305 [Alphaproteobacteria bacterium]|nr:hypothetical protein [Alphaproteobacteria bacterium]